MKTIIITIVCCMGFIRLHAQAKAVREKEKRAFEILINKYSEAREKKDTVLLRSIVSNELDQLVSNGEWRNGVEASVKGMINSSVNNPGTRTLKIERSRLLTQDCAIIDCRYEIKNPDGSSRNMWSTFIVVQTQGKWKISAIRNMLPIPS